MSHTTNQPDGSETFQLNETARAIISLLLFIHCFCITVVLSANFIASPVQQRLISAFAPYVRSLNFDPQFTRFHLTHAEPEHDDQFIEVVLAESPETLVARFPKVGWSLSDRYRRYHTLASALAFNANREFDSVSGEFARAIGAHVMQENDLKKVVVRCRWHRAQPLDPVGQGAQNPSDPNDEAYYDTVYEADVWIADDGSVQVLKKSSQREVAPAVTGAS